MPDEGITLIEWASIIQELLPQDIVEIKFTRFKDNPAKRLLRITGMNDSDE